MALLIFASKIAHGRFDVIWNYSDGTQEEIRRERHLHIPSEKSIDFASYSIAGNIGYIDASRHFSNLKVMAQSHAVPAVIIRLRNLFSIDFEGAEALNDAVAELVTNKTQVFISSASPHIEKELVAYPVFKTLKDQGCFTAKTTDAIALIKK